MNPEIRQWREGLYRSGYDRYLAKERLIVDPDLSSLIARHNADVLARREEERSKMRQALATGLVLLSAAVLLALRCMGLA